MSAGPFDQDATPCATEGCTLRSPHAGPCVEPTAQRAVYFTDAELSGVAECVRFVLYGGERPAGVELAAADRGFSKLAAAVTA